MGTSYTSNLTSQAHCSPEYTKYNNLYIDSRFILDLSFQIQISMLKTIDDPNHNHTWRKAKALPLWSHKTESLALSPSRHKQLKATKKSNKVIY